MLLALLLSQIPPPKMGMEAKKVKKFSKPIKWLLLLMVGFLSFWGFFLWYNLLDNGFFFLFFG